MPVKNKFSIFNSKFFYRLKQWFTNEYPDGKSETKRRKVAVENNLRWQDDGGPVVENTTPVTPANPVEVPGNEHEERR